MEQPAEVQEYFHAVRRRNFALALPGSPRRRLFCPSVTFMLGTMTDRAKQDLLTPVQYLKGVGPRRAEILNKLGISSARDVVFFFPRDYVDLTNVTNIRDLQEGPVYRLVGSVEEIDLRDVGGGRSMLGVLIKQGNEYVRALWFNQPFMQKQFKQGQRVVLTGKAKSKGFRWEMHHPKVEPLVGDESPTSGLQPVYRLTEGVSQHHMRAITKEAVSAFADEVPEIFTERLLERFDLLPISDALRLIHEPHSQAELKQARYRFAYQELLTMQLALAMRNASVTQSECPPLPSDGKIDARIKRLLPFELTEGQLRVVHEITADMSRNRPMNRMLQGDVGSGKTIVAAYAMLVAIANKHQTTIMAPTEILARQHFQTMSRMLTNSRVNMCLLTGSLTSAERRTALAKIATGDTDLVIGTQAVVQESVRFHRLGLAVVDEGHRFGVKQRARLRQGELEPHYLVMTATPIPRTVSMTMFGDLDVSVLRELPEGRKPVHTYVGIEQKRPQWWEFTRKKLREGRQAYVIAPLVDEKEDQDVSSVEQLFEQLCSEELDEFRVGLLHGRMSAEQKSDAMHRYRTGETQVLVATSLVEVGVDIPNACVMTIENAERFGLAQLHQLRGRVGRGKYPGFVCVYSPSDSPDARQRLEAFAGTTDGFELAEIDFRLRGPGDLFGTKQHGLPRLRVADLETDVDILERAREDARALVSADPSLESEELREFRERVMLRYGKSLQLGDIG